MFARTGNTRFIPAPAGNILTYRRRSSPPSVHPRACGEHLDPPLPALKSHGSSPRLRGTYGLAGDDNPGVGSSPRLRGTLEFIRQIETFGRFIPAPAGNIQPRPSLPRPGPVHPRACGEHLLGLAPYFAIVGSSPRLRGTFRSAGSDRLSARFIPAPAGNIPPA